MKTTLTLIATLLFLLATQTFAQATLETEVRNQPLTISLQSEDELEKYESQNFITTREAELIRIKLRRMESNPGSGKRIVKSAFRILSSATTAGFVFIGSTLLMGRFLSRDDRGDREFLIKAISNYTFSAMTGALLGAYVGVKTYGFIGEDGKSKIYFVKLNPVAGASLREVSVI